MLKIKTIDNKHHIDAKVHLIAASKTTKDSLLLVPATKGIMNDKQWLKVNKDISGYQPASLKPFHLYITSDEEIKIGDYYYNPVVREAMIMNKQLYGKVIEKCEYEHESKACLEEPKCFKIIATTDSSLFLKKEQDQTTWNELLPKPSDSFISKYIEEYNKGNIITDVLVQVDKVDGFIIIDKQNTITIRPIKNNWNREEHCTDMQYYMEYCIANGYVTPMNWLDNLKHY